MIYSRFIFPIYFCLIVTPAIGGALSSPLFLHLSRSQLPICASSHVRNERRNERKKKNSCALSSSLPPSSPAPAHCLSLGCLINIFRVHSWNEISCTGLFVSSDGFGFGSALLLFTRFSSLFFFFIISTWDSHTKTSVRNVENEESVRKVEESSEMYSCRGF